MQWFLVTFPLVQEAFIQSIALGRLQSRVESCAGSRWSDRGLRPPRGVKESGLGSFHSEIVAEAREERERGGG